MVPDVRPKSVTECDVTMELLAVERVPYAGVVPNSTCELEGWSVVQVMVTEDGVTPDEATAVITGAWTWVVKVKFVEVESEPTAFVDMAA